jgi:signal transduction histidine kinase
MNRSVFIYASRWIAITAIIACITVPVSYGLFYLVDRYATLYPTLYLVCLTMSVGTTVLLTTLLLPPTQAAVTRALFPGSFDYESAIHVLAEEVVQDAKITDVVEHICTTLSSAIGVKRVRVLSGTAIFQYSVRTKEHLVIPIPHGIPSSAILFSIKTNGDEWSRRDEQLLSRFATSVAVRLRVAQERDRELRRLKQVKELVTKATHDLAELNRTLELRKHDYAKRLDELAHDLKNPIIRMLNALDKETWTSAEIRKVKEFIEIRSELRWVTKFIDQLLELGRAGAGKVVLQKQTVFLYDIVEDAMTEIRSFVHEQGRQVRWNSLVNSMEDLQVIGDEGLIFKLLRLLLTRTTRLSRSNIDVSVTSDLKMTEAHIDILFAPHLNGAPAPHTQLLDQMETPAIHEDRRFGITGLELNIAKWILEAHNGKLTIPEADQNRIVIRATIPLGSFTKAAANNRQSLIF